MYKKKLENKTSLLIVCIISIIIVVSHFNLPKYKFNDSFKELTFDVTSYYLYLPMSFIFHDPGMKTKAIDSLHTKYKFSPTLFQIHNTENNTRVPNYTIGMSYFYFPFFLIGHLWALNSDYLKDGFSPPYQIAISIGVFLIILPGIFLLRRLLIQWFNDRVVSISLIILFLGTNYFSEAINNYLQPHALLFTLFVILLYFSKKWHDNNSYLSAFIIGITAGWITLTRPSDILCFLIPVLWGIYDKASLISKIQLLKNQYRHVLILLLAAVIPFIPQFIYWKITTGNYFYYSYKNTEGFDFLSPHILNVLFSFKKSLFIYTPLLIFPLVGLFLLPKRLPAQKNFIILFTLINFYLLSSWAAWWNGGSFGMRYFVQSYSILSIPLCISVERILKMNFKKYFIFSIIAFLIFLNLFQTWQFVNWILPEDRMTFKYYKKSFLKTNVTEEDRKLTEVKRSIDYTESFDNENEYNHYMLAYYNFEDKNSTTIDSTKLSTKYFGSPPKSALLSENNPYYPTYKIRYDHLVKEQLDHVWLRVTFDYYSEIDIKENPASLVINFPHNKYNLKYRAFDLDKYKFEKGTWNSLKIDYMTPFPYSEKDYFEIYIWYRGKNELYIDNVKIEVYEKK